jgi:uncharacterized protein (TIGR02246 family)
MIAALAAVALVAPVTAAPREDAQKAIMAVMTESAAGWTAGDLDRFMAVYAEEATFVVGDGVIRGKPAIAARYEPRFSGDRAAKRGALSFEEIDFRPIDPTHALLVARYRLKIEGTADQTGPTSLLFEKKWTTGWKIIADHSS